MTIVPCLYYCGEVGDGEIFLWAVTLIPSFESWIYPPQSNGTVLGARGQEFPEDVEVTIIV